MRTHKGIIVLIILIFATAACSTAYKVKPLPFRKPDAYPNVREVSGALVAAEAYADPKAAKEAFGFDIRGAGMLPVQLVFDNRGEHPLKINPEQTFLEDDQGNLWPILNRDLAYERATKYSQTKEIAKEAGYNAMLAAAAGVIIGAAVGIVTGSNIGEAIGKGAVVGGATGATLGGFKGAASDDARRTIISDLRDKTLKNTPVAPNTLAHGFLFFPGEATSAKNLRLQLIEEDTGQVRVIDLGLQPAAP